MLKELTRSDWLRLLQIPEERVPAAVILRGTRNPRTRWESARRHFSNIVEVGSPNGFIEDVYIGEIQGQPVGFACVYGGAMASEIVHIFGMLGTRLAIQTGNCGALSNELKAGDIFLVKEAFCGEGAAQYYKKDGKRVTASEELLLPGLLDRLGLGSFQCGSIYTTGALLAEGKQDLEDWYGQGFAAVDMETATTFAVAEYFGMQRLSVLYVFDNPRQQDHLLLTDAEKNLRRDRADAKILEFALKLAVSIELEPGNLGF